MSIVGIIAEFNPFHNGHKYIIDQAKALTGADSAIIVMSGNYVQRGTPAICDKFTRTKMAIECGCDLVIELPLIYSCGSAGYFAEGAVSLLNSLGCVDYLAFGAEYADKDFLMKISDIFVDEPQYFKERLNHYVKNGYSYPAARENASCDYLLNTETDFDENNFRDIMSSPNCILAVEYLCALKRFHSKIKAFPVTRIEAAYHQAYIQENISSATAIRNTMETSDRLEEARASIPPAAFAILKEEYNKSFPIYENDFSPALATALIRERDKFQDYYDFSLNFSNRVRNLTENYENFEKFASDLTTRNITRTYANRCLLHLMLGIENDFVKEIIKYGYNFYIHVLGFNPKGTELLKTIKAASNLPVMTKIPDVYDTLTPHGRKMLDLNLNADELYRFIQNYKFNTKLPSEFRRGLYMKKNLE